MDIKIKIVPNPLYGRPGSLVESPYIAQVVHTGTVTAADICEACKQENPQMTEPLASLATETIMDYGSDKVVTDVVRFNLGSAYFTMEPAVTGSVPTVDAPLSDENERYIKVVNGQSLNARIAALRPVIVNDDLGDVQFRSIETVEGEECFRNEIHGSGEFVALGKRLGGPDQKLQLFSKDGTLLSEATYVDSDLLGQRFTYRLATPPASDVVGDLALSSTGKDTPERNPKTISHEVKYVAPPGPHLFGDISSTDSEGQSVPGKFDPIDHPIVAMGGERLTRDASTSLVFEVKRGGETAFTKDLTDTLDTSLGVEGTLITYLDGQLYELLRSDDDALQNGDIVTATFTNALGSTTATGEVYNLP